MLALAWTVGSIEGEHAAYEGLALMYLYLGQVQKVKFYDARVSLGIYEPTDSQLFNITVSATLNAHPWLKMKLGLKEQSLVPGMTQGERKTGLDVVREQAEDLSRLGTHLTHFFAEKLHDYSLIKPDTI